MAKQENVIKKKSYDFALDIVNLYKDLVENQREYVLSKQVLRSGTSVGAMIRETEHAESKKDFLHKMNIALKEANESEYWPELLRDGNFISEKVSETRLPQISELIKILASIVKTTKSSLYR